MIGHGIKYSTPKSGGKAKQLADKLRARITAAGGTITNYPCMFNYLKRLQR